MTDHDAVIMQDKLDEFAAGPAPREAGEPRASSPEWCRALFTRLQASGLIPADQVYEPPQ